MRPAEVKPPVDTPEQCLSNESVVFDVKFDVCVFSAIIIIVIAEIIVDINMNTTMRFFISQFFLRPSLLR